MDSNTKVHEAIIASYREYLLFAKRLVADKSTAEDVVHDVLTIILHMDSEYIGQTIRRGKIDQYIRRAIYLRMFDKKSRRYKSLGESIESHNLFDAHVEPVSLADVDLKWFERTIITLKAEGYNMREIEELTGISKRNIEVALNKARQQITKHLEQ